MDDQSTVLKTRAVTVLHENNKLEYFSKGEKKKKEGDWACLFFPIWNYYEVLISFPPNSTNKMGMKSQLLLL